MAATAKVTDAWPAGIVTVGGTAAFVASLLVSVTTSGPVVSVFRVTVAVAVAPFSTVGRRSSSVSAGPSASFSSRLASADPWRRTTPVRSRRWL